MMHFTCGDLMVSISKLQVTSINKEQTGKWFFYQIFLADGNMYEIKMESEKIMMSPNAAIEIRHIDYDRKPRKIYRLKESKGDSSEFQ